MRQSPDHMLGGGQRCHNCGQRHPRVTGKYTAACVFIGARRHGSGSDEQLASERLSSCDFTTILIPSSHEEEQALFAQVWTWFEDIKVENDECREQLAQEYAIKGKLRAEAPLVWLRWKSVDGRKGQTRNAVNDQNLWRTLVKFPDDTGEAVPVAWLTLSSLSIPLNIPQSRMLNEGSFSYRSHVKPASQAAACS